MSETFPESASAASPNGSDTESALAALDTEFSGHLGVAALDLRTGRRVFYRADEVYPTASTVKLPILLQVAREVAEGRLAWTRRQAVDRSNQTPGSGIVQDLDEGLLLSLRDLATLMVVISDNTATNQCIDLVGGVDVVNASLRGWGCTVTTLHRKVSFEPDLSPPYFGTGTPADFAVLLEGLARGSLLPPDVTRDVLDILRRQHLTDTFARHLPYDWMRARETPDEVLTLYSKSGSIRGVRNEVGLVRGRDLSYAVAIFTRDCADGRGGPENEGARIVARASRLVWEWSTRLPALSQVVAPT